MIANKIISLRYQLVIGYILLVLGLALIGWTLWQSYNIFTDKVSASLIFKTQAAQPASGNDGTLDVQKQINDAVKHQLNQILPPDTITKILNLASWSILAVIFIFGGGALSGIGVKLVKL